MFKHEAKFMLLSFLAIVGFGFLGALMGSRLLGHSSMGTGAIIVLLFPSLFVVGGIVCLILAKVSLFRRGIWISFGPALMKDKARLYKIAYSLMGIGLLLFLWIALK